MQQTTFFFYHNLKNPDLLRKIDPTCRYTNGDILVEDYNAQTGAIILGNVKIIGGKLVTFNHSLDELIEIMSYMKTDLALDCNDVYEISKVMVNQRTIGLTEAYIIH